MEDHDNKNVVLELDNQRFNVNKKKLINKSLYFAALLSENFIDHTLSVHKIEFDISVISLQDFINCWINSDERNVTINAVENMSSERLLTLLNLSVLYQVKDEFKLTEIIIDVLQNHNLSPEDAFIAWMMAEQLDLIFNFKMLRDLSFSICLDRFTELPTHLICELSEENFRKLITNTNLRIPKTIDAKAYLSDIVQEWMKVNKKDKFTILLDNLKKPGPKVYKSIISFNRQNYRDNNEFNLHCWDGDKSFEFATIKLPEEIINNQIPIRGMKITARGHNLYFIGGVFDINLAPKVLAVNTKVWRYSLITKKWHFETIMPCIRINMFVGFVQNKLLLVGGYGSNNEKLKTLDIYDVHKGIWTKGINMPFTYIDYFGHFNVVDKYLICFTEDAKSIYIYNSEINYWCKVAKIVEQKLHLHDLHITPPVIKQFKSASCYVDGRKEDRIYLNTIVCDNSEYKQKFFEKYAEYLRIEEKYKEESNFDMYFYFVGFRTYDYFLLFCSKNENVEYKLVYLKTERLPWYKVPIQNLNTYQLSSLEICSTMFSNLMDPAHLYAK